MRLAAGLLGPMHGRKVAADTAWAAGGAFNELVALAVAVLSAALDAELTEDAHWGWRRRRLAVP